MEHHADITEDIESNRCLTDVADVLQMPTSTGEDEATAVVNAPRNQALAGKVNDTANLCRVRGIQQVNPLASSCRTLISRTDSGTSVFHSGRRHLK